MKCGPRSRASLLLVAVGATLLLNQTCNTRSPVPESFVAAIVRSDRILETRSSADGVAWSGSHLHTDLGRMDYGPGLASDASGALVFLAAFGKTNSGSTKLFVRAGLGDHWETDFPNQIVVSTASAPAICPLDDHHFFIAWNSGARGIATAILDTQRAGHPDSVTRLPDINDALAADIEGAPSVAVSGTRVLIVWRRHPRNDAASLAANRATYRSADASVEFGTSRGLSVTPSTGSVTGFPQLTTSGTSFVLATGLAAGLQRAYAYFVSPDGITWTSFACASTIPVLASSDRPHAVAAGGSSRIVQIVAPTDPDSSTSNERGLIIRNCSSESAWTESTVFVERGSARFQPAIAFRTRQ